MARDNGVYKYLWQKVALSLISRSPSSTWLRNVSKPFTLPPSSYEVASPASRILNPITISEKGMI
jgi:hypothetical protein